MEQADMGTATPSTDGQMKDITSVLVTAVPDHEDFSRAKMDYWHGNKGMLKAKVRQLLEDVPRLKDHVASIRHWEWFYRQALKTKVDFSDIELPDPSDGVAARYDIVPVVSSGTLSLVEIVEALKANFEEPFSLQWAFGSEELDKSALQLLDAVEPPEGRPSGHYGILVRGGRSADLDAQIAFAHDGVRVKNDPFYVFPHDIPAFPRGFMTPREYILFVAFHRFNSPWKTVRGGWCDDDGSNELNGTTFPTPFPASQNREFLSLRSGNDHRTGGFQICLLGRDDDKPCFGRRVKRVLPGLRHA